MIKARTHPAIRPRQSRPGMSRGRRRQPLHGARTQTSIVPVDAIAGGGALRPGRFSRVDRSRWLARAIARLQVARHGMRWRETALRDMICTGAIAGFCRAFARPGSPVRLDGYVLFRTMADEAEILALAVRASRRHQGLARALVHRAMGDLRSAGIRRVFLEVAKTNRAAVGFYKAVDFVEVGRRRNYYALSGTVRVDALVMRRVLFLPSRQTNRGVNSEKRTT